jgi:hypothetical protein
MIDPPSVNVIFALRGPEVSSKVPGESSGLPIADFCLPIENQTQ